MLKKQVFIGLFTVLITVAIIWVWLTPGSPSIAPDVALKTIDGRKIELNKLQGQPVLVTFWATTCVVCTKEIPHLVALYKELAPQGLEIVGVAMSYDPPNQVHEMTKRKQIPYPIALDIDGSVASAFGKVMVTPTSFLIASDGTIVIHKIGEIDIKKIRDEIIVMLSAEQHKSLPQSS